VGGAKAGGGWGQVLRLEELLAVEKKVRQGTHSLLLAAETGVRPAPAPAVPPAAPAVDLQRRASLELQMKAAETKIATLHRQIMAAKASRTSSTRLTHAEAAAFTHTEVACRRTRVHAHAARP
jgi:hypothetical protein